jgi:lysophospholipase
MGRCTMTLISLARNPVPSGATVGVLKTPDGKNLRYAFWDATRAPLRGTCLVVQGRTEFIEKYFEVVADLRRRGYAVAVFDFRGQGGSDRALSNPCKGHVRHFNDYETDITTIMAEIVRPHLPSPYIAIGHSLGGHVLLRMASHAESPFYRMVLTGPMIRLADACLGMPQAAARAVAEVVSLSGGTTMFVPGGSSIPAESSPFAGNVYTSDEERYLRARCVVEAAPHLALGAPTIGWMRAALRSMAILQSPDAPRGVRVPILFVGAGEDKIVSTTAVEEFALKTKLGSRVLIAASRHEILQESDDIRGRFWSAFDAYLADHAQAA